MKKLITIAATIGILAGAALAADRYTGTVVVPAGATTGAITQEVFKADGPPANTINTVFANVESGSGTGVVTFAQFEFGKSDTIVASTSLRYGGASFWDRPVTSESVLYTYPVVQNVATGQYSQVVLAVQNLQTNYAVQVKSFVARQLLVSVVQEEAMSDDTVYRWVVMVDEDPPAKK